MENFSPISAVFGGLIIGLSAVLLMAMNGRIAGISGIFSGTFFAAKGDHLWRVFFIFGLVLSPLLYTFITGSIPVYEPRTNTLLLIVAGLLVGFGSRLGSGCTSGHGVCGLSRLSLRSAVSVVTFMITGMLTATLLDL